MDLCLLEFSFQLRGFSLVAFAFETHWTLSIVSKRGLLLFLLSSHATVLRPASFRSKIVHVFAIPWVTVSGVLWERILRCWFRIFSSFRSTLIGYMRFAFGRLFSELPGASLLLVLRCSFSGHLPKEYSVLIAPMIAFRSENHYWMYYIHLLSILWTSWIAENYSTTFHKI